MKFYLTESGSRKLSEVVAGSVMTITKAVASDIVSNEPKKLAEIPGKKQSIQINSLNIDNGIAVLKLTISNLEVNQEYQLKQIGIYASFGTEEILFIVGQDKAGERVPAISDREIEYDYQISFAFDTAAEVRISVSANDFIKKTEAISLLDRKVDKNEIVNKLEAITKSVIVNVTNDRWSGSAPFTQRIEVQGIKAVDTPIISHWLLDGVTDATTIKGAWKAYSCIDRIDTYDGYIIVTCFRKKPIQSFFLAIKGV